MNQFKPTTELVMDDLHPAAESEFVFSNSEQVNATKQDQQHKTEGWKKQESSRC